MTTIIGLVRGRLLGISPEEATFSRRGFYTGDTRARDHLERVGRVFIGGYQAALEEVSLDQVVTRLDVVEPALQGFAYEGASMAFALLDRLSPRKHNRIESFLRGPGVPHRYMVHVGLGWAMARLPSVGRHAAHILDPLLRWLVLDGYGFHQAYFHPRRFVDGHEAIRFRAPYAAHAVDQGIGRALWFVNGADPARVAKVIASFPAARRPDLWSGLGLAATYAGGTDQAGLEALRVSAGSYLSQVAQGAAFAAKARLHAGNLTTHTARSTRVFCGISARAAAVITDEALPSLPASAAEPEPPSYELWRRRIQLHFADIEV
jgi:hypothetical protein